MESIDEEKENHIFKKIMFYSLYDILIFIKNINFKTKIMNLFFIKLLIFYFLFFKKLNKKSKYDRFVFYLLIYD